MYGKETFYMDEMLAALTFRELEKEMKGKR